jgi:3-(3-hydroxy-phenyl)propionate hydroxylase
MLTECRGVVKDTPRQDMLPCLSTGMITHTPGAGSLFPQPRLAAVSGDVLLDVRHGYGFRLISDGTLSLPPDCELPVIDLARTPETQGVAAAWFARHRAHIALLRPDHYTFGSAADESGLSALLYAFRALRFQPKCEPFDHMDIQHKSAP